MRCRDFKETTWESQHRLAVSHIQKTPEIQWSCQIHHHHLWSLMLDQWRCSQRLMCPCVRLDIYLYIYFVTGYLHIWMLGYVSLSTLAAFQNLRISFWFSVFVICVTGLNGRSNAGFEGTLLVLLFVVIQTKECTSPLSKHCIGWIYIMLTWRNSYSVYGAVHTEHVFASKNANA